MEVDVQSRGCSCALEPPAWKLLAVSDNTFLCIQGILICPISALTFSAKEQKIKKKKSYPGDFFSTVFTLKENDKNTEK